VAFAHNACYTGRNLKNMFVFEYMEKKNWIAYCIKTNLRPILMLKHQLQC